MDYALDSESMRRRIDDAMAREYARDRARLAAAEAPTVPIPVPLQPERQHSWVLAAE